MIVREWCGKLKPVKHKAHSRDHRRAELLEAGFEGDVLDRGSRGVVLLGGALGDPDYKHAHVAPVLAGGHARMDAALPMQRFQERLRVVFGSAALIPSYLARIMPLGSYTLLMGVWDLGLRRVL